MGNTLAQLGSALTLGVALAGAPNTASAQSTQVAEQTQGKVEILLAQAGVEKQEFVVYVRQVDANGNLTEKTVEVRYTKGEGGWIIPPDTKGGNLLDGTPSTGNPKLDKAKNITIIGKYDKDKQIVLAMTDKNDIIRNSSKTIREFARKIENKQEITKDDLMGVYIANYIFAQANFENETERYKKVTESLDIVAKSIFKLSPQEVEQMKQKAKEVAITRWQSVTRSLG